MRALERKLLRDLLHMRGQMIAVILVVACGIATYVALVSVHQSLLATRSAYYEHYRFADLFATVRRAPRSLVSSIEMIPGVAAVDARVVTDVTLDVPGLADPASGRIVSIPERRTPMLNELHIRSGRYIERSNEAIISEAFAAANQLGPGDSLGMLINGRWKQVRVVGVGLSPEYVYVVRPASIFPDNRRYGVLWMGHDALASAFDMKGAFNDLALRLARDANADEVIARIDDILRPYGSLGAQQENTSKHFLQDEINQLKTQAFYTPIVFLGVAAFLLHILLSRLVSTQRDQIAVLKAFGYGNIRIALHYLGFSSAAIVGGSILGVASGMYLGSLLTGVYTHFFHFPILRYAVGGDVIVKAVAISAAAATLGAISATLRALALPPAEAMRPEPPARFKPGLLERIGLQRILSPNGRMVLRGLERNPMKAGISILGISFSVAILLMGRFSFDALDVMMDLQFHVAQREKMMVVFDRPLPSRACYDLLHLPGVMRAESFRSIPVEARHRHRSRRLAVMGIRPGNDMHRYIDADRRVVRAPLGGAILTRTLAEVLDISVGDTLRLEVLDGERLQRRVLVAGLVDELMGMSIYMQQDALDRLFDTRGMISGAFLQIDETKTQELYDRLKRTPAITGVIVHKTVIDSFKETTEGNQRVTSFFVIFFAGVIAIGIVYNSARIGLSERGRELASLRVLGFTNSEVAALLLGEQALLILVAIPVGNLLGYLLAVILSIAVSNEMYRMPAALTLQSYLFATIVVVCAGLLSGVLVRRRILNLDLIEVLKTRE